MTPAPVPSAFFTASSLVLAGLLLLGLRLMMRRSPANLAIAGFIACVIPSPLMLVAHPHLGLVMVGIGLACLVPALVFAEDHDDDWRDGRRDPEPVDPDPDPGSGPDLWDEFERDFWAHVDRTRELVHS